MTKQKETDIILSARNIKNRFGKQIVHNGINLDVRRGEVLGIAGGSGSGKSVLLKTLLGLHQPDAGEIEVAGKPIGTYKSVERAAMLGVLFQEGALFSSMNVEQNIMLPLREYTALPPETQAELARLKLGLVGLGPETARKFPSQLSGGMATRAALARALIMDPAILFLDEPTAGLDPVLAHGFDELIVDLNHSLGVTMVIVTHDLDTLFGICGRVAFLADKKLIVAAVPDLLRDPDPKVKDFFHGTRARGAAIAAGASHGNG